MMPSAYKKTLRSHYLQVRHNLSKERQKQASRSLTVHFEKLGLFEKKIGSFHSILGEIDLSAVNANLSNQNRLFLPLIEKEGLQFYCVRSIDKELRAVHPFLLEPDPTLCEPISICDLDLILTPGLAFDANHYRLGYGKGYYDRTMQLFPMIRFMGIGFREQQTNESLSIDPWDQPVSSLLLL